MRLEWVFIETFAILVENLAIIYFLNSRYISKFDTHAPQFLAWASLSACGLIVMFIRLPNEIYSVISIVIMLAFLKQFKYGKFIYKILGVIFVYVILFATSFIGAGIASILTNVHIEDTITYQEQSRLLAIIFIKAMQVMLFFMLAKRKATIHGVKKTTLFLYIFITAIILLSLAMLFTSIDVFYEDDNLTLIWVSVSLLVVILAVYFLYEVFMRQEIKNIELTKNVQRMEMESEYIDEIDAVYAEIRKWRHQYNADLLALLGYIQNGENDAAINYINKVNKDASANDNLLQTNNVVLDAVGSAKFAVALSKGIKINKHVMYPSDCEIEDRDWAAIVSNLLDNAIEACLRITDDKQEKFISFLLLPKGRNVTLSVANSYNGEVKKQGERFLTTKEKKFEGIGMQYVDSIAEKYDGTISRKYDEHVFETQIVLPIKLYHGPK